ncbi:MAG: 50S ribosomal protein L24 [Patescibacteria group bacterium]|jgi:large subunit ribosomal protein L24
MKIRKGDKVQIIIGKDKGKTGKVAQVFPAAGQLIVEGLNLLVKNTRAKKQGEKGQQVLFPAKLKQHKVMLVCPQCGEKTKIGYKMAETVKGEKLQLKNKKFRQCRKCHQSID